MCCSLRQLSMRSPIMDRYMTSRSVASGLGDRGSGTGVVAGSCSGGAVVVVVVVIVDEALSIGCLLLIVTVLPTRRRIRFAGRDLRLLSMVVLLLRRSDVGSHLCDGVERG